MLSEEWWEKQKQLEELSKQPVILLMKYDDVTTTSQVYLKSGIARFITNVSWEDDYLKMETKMGHVLTIITSLVKEPTDIILSDTAGLILASGIENIKSYLSTIGFTVPKLYKKPQKLYYEETVKVLPLETFKDKEGATLWKGIYWEHIKEVVKNDPEKSESEKRTLLKELSYMKGLDDKRFLELYNWLTKNFSIIIFEPGDAVIEIGVLTEIPKENIKRRR